MLIANHQDVIDAVAPTAVGEVVLPVYVTEPVKRDK